MQVQLEPQQKILFAKAHVKFISCLTYFFTDQRCFILRAEKEEGGAA